MCFALRHPMQVDASVDRLAAARDLLLHATAKRRERRRCRAWCTRSRRHNCRRYSLGRLLAGLLVNRSVGLRRLRDRVRSGRVERIENLSVDRYIHVVEGKGLVR